MSNKYNIKEFNKFKDYSKDFKEDYKKTSKELSTLYTIPKNLTPIEKSFIFNYGLDSSDFITYLRDKYNGLVQTNIYFEKYYKFLNSGINKFDNIKVDSILHRNVSNDFYIADVNEISIFNTPTSTTFNSNANKSFGEYHISILAPKGSKGAYIEELMNKEIRNNHLNEWLLPSGTKYKTLYKNYYTKEAIILLIKG